MGREDISLPRAFPVAVREDDCIGITAFECIGESPPDPHVFLKMGELEKLLCPYCNRLYCFDPASRRLNPTPQIAISTTDTGSGRIAAETV